MTGENELIYREEQRFGLWLRWLVVLSMASAVPFSIFSLTKISSEQGSPEILPIILLTITGIFVPTAVALLFGMLKLQTEVRPDGLYILTYVSPVPSDMILILELEQSSTSRGLSLDSQKMNGKEGAYGLSHAPVHLPASTKRSGCSSAEPYPLDRYFQFYGG